MGWNWIHVIAVVVLNCFVFAVWKPWAGAYSGEKAKNFARKEDLQAILAEVRAVTAVQKDIEAQISGGLWTEQWRLNNQRDAYISLFSAVSTFERTFNDYTEHLDAIRETTPDRTVPADSMSAEMVRSLNAAFEELARAEAVSLLFCSDNNMRIAITELRKRIEELQQQHTRLITGNAPNDDFEYLKIAPLLIQLVKAARIDLGIENPPRT